MHKKHFLMLEFAYFMQIRLIKLDKMVLIAS